MNRLLRLSPLLAGLALVVLPSCALVTLPYIYAGTGISRTNSSTGDSPKFQGSVDEQSAILNVGAGASLGENFGLEAGVADLGSHSWNGRWNGAPNSGHVSTSSTHVSLLGMVPLSEMFSVVGRLGMLFYQSDYYENAAGFRIEQNKDGNSPMYGLGVQAAVIDQVAIRLEWTRVPDIWDDSVDLIQLQALYTF
ncbi:MAG: outer membrane beta-barrel protein [Planctomycetes bacterium]|nr:outer membrane beta-barrel protein [Planctomycetota bacterium]